MAQTCKEQAHQLVDQLPDSAGWAEFVREIAAVQEAEAASSSIDVVSSGLAGPVDGVAPRYVRLVITASESDLDIWLGDDEGFLVEKAVGVLRTCVLEGDYVVEFGLGTDCYPLALRGHSWLAQADIQAGPTCKRSVPEIS